MSLAARPLDDHNPGACARQFYEYIMRRLITTGRLLILPYGPAQFHPSIFVCQQGPQKIKPAGLLCTLVDSSQWDGNAAFEKKRNAVCPTLTVHSTNSDQRRDNLAEWHGVHTVLPATHTFIYEWNDS